MSIHRVISGFQDGCDLGGIKAAVALGLEVGGTMPKGFLTESGPKPEYARLYGAVEHELPEYPPRTRQNIADADLTLIFNVGVSWSRGTTLAVRVANELAKRFVIVDMVATPSTYLVDALVRAGGNETFVKIVDSNPMAADVLRDHLARHEVRVLNVAGNRESKSPGIEAWVEEFCRGVFDRGAPASLSQHPSLEHHKKPQP